MTSVSFCEIKLDVGALLRKRSGAVTIGVFFLSANLTSAEHQLS